MRAMLEIFWPDKVSTYDGLPDSIAIRSARMCALCGGHAIATLSDGLRAEYTTDNNESIGYKTIIG